MTQTRSSAPVIIKKYANRRLYDTSASRYVTLDHLRDLVKENVDFQVVDAKSGEDLTRGVLTQIIFEEESKGANLLPVEFLRQLIGFYGDSLQAFVPGYLRLSMERFARQQEALRTRMADAVGAPPASMAMLEEQTRRNMAVFEQAMKMFSPFAAGRSEGPPAAEDQSEVAQLRREMEAIRAKLDKLSSGGGGEV